MGKNVVEIEGLTKDFRGLSHHALDKIDATIRAGVITGIVGPDGAGKTTLMRLMAGLLDPTAGTIRVDGLDPGNDSGALRDFIGYMPQKFGLYEDLSVQENLNLHADLRGLVGEERQKTFERLLTFTDLAQFTDRRAGALSGGMKQKLGLACALLGRPRLLLLDEPSVGVDPISRRELWKIVQNLTHEGIAVVWSTAYLDEAELCAEILLLNQGKLLFSGTPTALSERMQGRSFQLRNLTGRKRQILAQALRQPEVLDGVIQGDSLRLLLTKEGKKPDLTTLRAGDRAEFVSVKPRFEDAFIDILGGPPKGDSTLADHLEQIPRTDAVVIEADHLTKKFGDFLATDDISFQVKQGEIFGLLGPNGAGKSTTFKMMCGLLRPTSGRAQVAGIDLKTSGSKARQKLGYMAQKFSLYGLLTVLQNLTFSSGIYGLVGNAQKQASDDMVKIFHLDQFLGSKTDSLSLGYKQRLALACAIMHDPVILFLDEPTSGVDPVTRREFWTHINTMVESGVTVMVTTHFMDEAEYCDRIGLVYRGKLIAIGTPDELKEKVATPERPDPTMEDAFIDLITSHPS